MYEIEMYAVPTINASTNTSATNVNQTYFPFMPILTHSQQTWMETITSIFGWLSLICTFFLLLTYGTFKMKRQYPANFTFYFCIAAFATDAAFVIGSLVGYERLLTPEWYDACYAQAIALQFFGSATCTWWFLLTVNLYYLATKKTSHKKYMKYYHIVAWGWCVVLTILPIPFQKYGPAGLWCWIIEADRSAWQFGLLYGWMGVLVIVGCVLWCLIIASMVRSRRNGTFKERFSRYFRYVLFVLLMMLVWTLIVVHRILHAINPADNSFILWLLHAWALSSIGVFVFLIFGTAKDMYTVWGARLKTFWIRIRARYDPDASTNSEYQFVVEDEEYLTQDSALSSEEDYPTN